MLQRLYERKAISNMDGRPFIIEFTESPRVTPSTTWVRWDTYQGATAANEALQKLKRKHKNLRKLFPDYPMIHFRVKNLVADYS